MHAYINKDTNICRLSEFSLAFISSITDNDNTE